MKLKRKLNYCFMNNYKLGTLKDLEEFIDSEKNKVNLLYATGNIINYLLKKSKSMQTYVIDVNSTMILSYTAGEPEANYTLDDVLDIRFEKEDYREINVEVEVDLYESGQKL